MDSSRRALAVAVALLVGFGLAVIGSTGILVPAADAAMSAPEWRDAIDVPGLTALGGPQSWLTKIACTSPGNCVAGGSFTSGSSVHPMFVDLVDGVWGDAYEVPGSWAFDGDDIERRIDQLACAPDGGCVAAGRYETGRGRRAFVTRRVDGVWSDAEPMPNASELAGAGNVGQYFLTGAACSSSGNCSIVGFYFGGTTAPGGFIVDLVDAVWYDAIDPPGLLAMSAGGSSYLRSVSCPVDGGCSATGSYTGMTTAGAVVIDQSHGQWGMAAEVSGLTPLATGGAAEGVSIACSSAGSCSVGGSYTVIDVADPTRSYLVPFVSDRVGGHWTDAQPRMTSDVVAGSVSVVSCPTDGNCSAIGRFQVPADPVLDHDSLFSIQRIDGVWSTPVELPGLAALNTANGAKVEAISCPVPGTCAATGHYTDATGEVPFVVNSVDWVWGAPIAVPGVHGPSVGVCTYNFWGDPCPTGRSVACPSADWCAVVGDTYPDASGRAFISEYVGSVVPDPEPDPVAPTFTG